MISVPEATRVLEAKLFTSHRYPGVDFHDVIVDGPTDRMAVRMGRGVGPDAQFARVFLDGPRVRQAIRIGGGAVVDIVKEAMDACHRFLFPPRWRFRIHTHARKLRRVS